MKFATIAYLPPDLPGLNVWAFCRNLDYFKMRHPLITFGDEPGRPIEHLKESTCKVATNNYVFLRALKTAKMRGVDWFCYLESDSRVGADYWDSYLFEQIKVAPIKAVTIGCPAAWDMNRAQPAYREAVRRYGLDYTQRSTFPFVAFNAKSHQLTRGAGLFHIGSVCLYNTDALSEIFFGFENDIEHWATTHFAFDLYIGIWLAERFGVVAVQQMQPWLRGVWSGQADWGFNYDERAKLLRDGKIVAGHQFKTQEEFRGE